MNKIIAVFKKTARIRGRNIFGMETEQKVDRDKMDPEAVEAYGIKFSESFKFLGVATTPPELSKIARAHVASELFVMVGEMIPARIDTPIFIDGRSAAAFFAELEGVN